MENQNKCCKDHLVLDATHNREICSQCGKSYPLPTRDASQRIELDNPLKILEAYHRHKEALTIGIKTENNPEKCVQAIQQLLTEARIDELKATKKIQNEAHVHDPNISKRIEELQAQLNGTSASDSNS